MPLINKGKCVSFPSKHRQRNMRSQWSSLSSTQPMRDIIEILTCTDAASFHFAAFSGSRRSASEVTGFVW